MAEAPTGERLLEAVGELVRELGAGGRAAPASLSTSWRVDEAFSGLLEAEDERLATALTESLTELAAKASCFGEAPFPVATAGALRGAEFVIRSELAAGNRERLAGFFPSFVYVLTIPHLGQAGALDLSRRMGELLD